MDWTSSEERTKPIFKGKKLRMTDNDKNAQLHTNQRDVKDEMCEPSDLSFSHSQIPKPQLKQ
jgi:hypothetical protein